MKVGIVVAVVREFEAFLEDSSLKVELIKSNHHDVYKTLINNNEVFVINSGYGEIDASAATQLLISEFDCEMILNYGVVGALKKELKVKDLFLIDKVVHYDYDVSQIDPVRPHQYNEFKDEFIPTNKELDNKIIKLMPNIKCCICASGDKFIVDKAIKEDLSNQFDASICDMESAAIIRTSYKNRIPCASIKCISDTYDGDGKDYESNVVESSSKAFNLIKNLLQII
jgi:adenosylhomocysteine nucleosidase